MRASFMLWAIVLGTGMGACTGAVSPTPKMEVYTADRLIRWVDIDLGVVCYGRPKPPVEGSGGWEGGGTLSCVKLGRLSGGDL